MITINQQSALMIAGLKNIFLKLRLSDPWRYKAPLLMAVPYLVIKVTTIEFGTAITMIGASLILIVGFAGFGYVTNDWADIKKDVLAGKPNFVVEMGTTWAMALVLFFITLVILPWLVLPFSFWSAALIVLELLLFIIYAFPPFRLKEKGMLGIISDTLYAHVVPTIFAAYTFWLPFNSTKSNFMLFIALLACWQLVWGIRNIINHQLVDYDNDLRSHNNTLVVQIGATKAAGLLKLLLVPVEVLIFLVFTGYTILIIGTPLLFIYLFFTILLLIVNRFVFSQFNSSNFRSMILDDFYLECLPLCYLALLVLSDWKFLALLLLHITIFRKNIIVHALQNVFAK